MKKKRWSPKKTNSDWELHEQKCKQSFEQLGFEVIKEDTRPYNGGIKAGKGKCDLQVLKNGELWGYFECKNTKDALGLPDPRKRNPDIKLHQMEFLTEKMNQGYYCGFIIRYYTEETSRVFVLEMSALMQMYADNVKVVNGKLVKPSITLPRLLKYGHKCNEVDSVYDFSGWVV